MRSVYMERLIFTLLVILTYLPMPLLAENTTEKPPLDTVDFLIKFVAKGKAVGFDPQTGESDYLINATGYLPEINDGGIVNKKLSNDTPIAQLENAIIRFEYFDFSAPPPVVKFTCLGCTIRLPDGTVLESDPEIALNGRALFSYGPVNTGMAYTTIRMMGCAGLKETRGQGSYANMVGSICFNGVFNFDLSDPPMSLASITGLSNCTISLHTPQ
ncbi:MAG: hypothetical protein ACC707_00460 [Thiohalomonadales bacterium]